MNSSPHPNDRPATEKAPRGYDPDWPSGEELRSGCAPAGGLGFFRGLLAAAALLALLALVALLCAMLAGSFGCATDPATGDVTITVPAAVADAATNAAARAVVAIREAREREDSAAPDPIAPTDSEHTENAEGGLSVGPVDASAPSVVLDFRYGGVKAKPTEDSRCRISKLRIGSDSLSFHWDTGIPSDWQRGDTKKGPMILACAFYEDGGKWVGGKFDWIDEARASRPLENIHTGYGGWNAAAWAAAKRRAFCVMSADGRHRSNLLEETR